MVDYDARDIFNADETGIFYKCLPDRTLTFKNEKKTYVFRISRFFLLISMNTLINVTFF